jgi:hypothetical protein
MLELIPMRPFLPGFRAHLREFLPRSQVMSIAARRLNCPLPATSYDPPCEKNIQQEFRSDVSNRELIAERNCNDILADATFAAHESTIRPCLICVLEGIPGRIRMIVSLEESRKPEAISA